MTDSSSIEAIGQTLRAGGPLSADEIAVLAETRDVVRLGALADERRRARCGDRVTFVRVAEAAAADVDAEEVPAQAGELRLAGCPDAIDDLLEAVRRAVGRAGATPVTGFALDELVDRAGGDADRFADLVAALRGAGLAAIAEACVDRLPEAAWAARAAAGGLPVARVAVIDPAAGGLAAIRRVADWSAAAGVRAFAPLPRTAPGVPSTGYQDVRHVALARLLVNNVVEIQVDWRVHGPQLAQVALAFGASDVDRIDPVDTLEHGPRRAPLEEITRHIRAAGLAPVERDGRFDARERHHE